MQTTMQQDKTVVLAFSGGLDTSFCVLDLLQQGFRVETVYVNSGGGDAHEAEHIKARALSLGADRHHEIDIREALWTEFVLPLLHGGGRYQGQYPLLCSDRYLIVQECLKLCDALNTPYFAHGCTAMGNDQMRFDQSVHSLGHYSIIAPIRDLQKRCDDIRSYEIEVLKQAGHEVALEHKRYSVNENLLGVTWSGSEIDEYQMPADDAWRWCKPRAHWPDETLHLDITFRQGVPVALNHQALTGAEFLQKLNKILGNYGVGRAMYTGDTVIGLKGRILFECPGLEGLMVAAQALLECVSTQKQNQFRPLVAQQWCDLVYSGFYFEPHKQDLEAYLKRAVNYANGTVRISTDGGQVVATAIDAPARLQHRDIVYAQKAPWTPEQAEGFIKLAGLSSTMAAQVVQHD
ncbi:MAG: argininosuccinate synthase [Xanthomonadales bacterium]|nr:argininosuccinate synthase [Xanthomonadales bacterium]